MIKEIWKKFKRWIIGLLAVLSIFGLAQIANPSIPVYSAEYVTAPENNSFKIGVQNYQTFFRTNIASERPLQYKLGDKFISFRPIGMSWNTSPAPHRPVRNANRPLDRASYKGTFGSGIDLAVNTSDRVWNKVVKIGSLGALGEIPKDAQYLEIKYEVETNFIINGWNKHDDFEITDIVRLGDYSYIEPAMAWDSYSEEVCEYDPELEEEVCEILTNRIQVKSYFTEDKGKFYYTKQIPVLWLKSAQQPIYTDADITYGTASQYITDVDENIHMAKLDTDKFVVCSVSVTDNLYCVVGEVSETTISWGGTQLIDSTVMRSYYDQQDVCSLGTDKFVAIWQDDVSDDDGYAVAATTIATTTITLGTVTEWKDSDVEDITCAKVDTDKFVICYNDETAGDDFYCIGSTVSGTTITVGNPARVTTNKAYFMASAQLDTDKFVTVFQYQTTQDLTAIVGTTATSTWITYGSMNTYSTDFISTQILDVIKLDTDKYVTTWPYNDCKAVVATVSGTTITDGSTQIIDYGCDSSDRMAVTDLDTTHAVMAYSDNSNSDKGTSNYTAVDFSARTISTSSSEVFEEGSTSFAMPDAQLISSDKIVICFRDGADTNGKCIIGDYGVAPPPAEEMEVIIISQNNNN